jgi:hypothetical protein
MGNLLAGRQGIWRATACALGSHVSGLHDVCIMHGDNRFPAACRPQLPSAPLTFGAADHLFQEHRS